MSANQKSADSASVNKLKSGSRLRAARLLRRIPSLEEAARKIDVPGATLRGAESGRRAVGTKILKGFQIEMGVSGMFILGLGPRNSFEADVERLADLLAEPAMSKLTEKMKRSISQRLRALRIAAGYASATEAATKLGWGRASYVNYEGYNSKMSLDRAVVFALDLNGDAELFLNDLGGTVPADGTVPVEQARTDSEAVSDQEAERLAAIAKERWHRRLRWAIHPTRHEGSLRLAMIEPTSDGLELLDRALQLPEAMLPGVVNDPDEDMFAFPMDGWTVTAVIRRVSVSEDVFFVYDGHRARPRDPDEEFRYVSDPLQYRPGGVPAALGKVVAIVKTEPCPPDFERVGYLPPRQARKARSNKKGAAHL